ncbi:DUF1772 domain-containing protein [Nocardia mexicana]|uniref:DUF1772 domain-containing protein n=1 Tax=Nocardia mexicana TaxID=279262 RepID=A0A370GSY9_9NOCA|nr:DUF1772 domain-containing protein [Nocardia mexicana]RDI46817.1 hypothetical protein DFR68_110223 [Nocardia mexicana]
MFTTIAQVLAVLAVLGNGIVYGADATAALIMRSVYRRLDDATMTKVAGWGHYYGDRRMPFAGVGGVVTAALAVVAAAVAGHAAASIAAGVALAALLIWLAFYVRVAKPINTAQTAAAQSGVIPSDARALQEKWDSILGFRIGLQATAVAALGITLILL